MTIHKDLPPYKFEFYESNEEPYQKIVSSYLEIICIAVYKGNALSEIISTKTIYDGRGLFVDAAPDEDVVQIRNRIDTVDANFDGYQDLRIVGGIDEHGTTYPYFFLYNPKTDRFLYSTELQRLMSAYFDPKTKEIYSNCGTACGGVEVYTFENGKLMLQRMEQGNH